MVTKHFSYFLNNSRGPLQIQILSEASGITSCCLFARHPCERGFLEETMTQCCLVSTDQTERHLVAAQ